MTVSTTPPEVIHAYTGPGDYTFNFRVFEGEDLQLVHFDAAGVATTLDIITDYTVTVATMPTVGGDCHVTYAPTTGTLRIRRNLPVEQETEWDNNDPFNAEQLERDLDHIVMILQQQDVVTGGVVEGPPGYDISLPYPDEGKALKWESDDLVNSIYNVDEQLEAALAAQEAAEAAQAAAEHAANIAASKIDTVPTGTIVAWLGGYFTDGVNGGYTKVLDFEAGSFKLCDGSEFYDADSPIFNVAGRHLPNLTDERWLQGNTEVNIGAVGGDNDVIIPGGAHVHATQGHVLTPDEAPIHNHSQVNGSNWFANSTSGYPIHWYTLSNSANVSQELAHDHGDTLSAGGGGGVEDNRPKYLDVLYIMKVKTAFITEGYEYFTVPITP